MNKDQKQNTINLIKSNLLQNQFIAVIHYRGMNDKQLYDMRVSLKSNGCGMKISKNTLLRIALRETKLDIISGYISGPSALLFSDDPVALSKIISDIAKKSEFLKIIVGLYNKNIVNEDAILNMAKLGSKEEVRSKFLGILNVAQSNFVRVLTAPGKGLATLKV